MSYKRYFGLLIAAVVTISMFRPQNVEASEKVLTSSRETLMVGKSISLKVNVIKSSKVKWKSSKTSVATVNKSGVVKEKKAGSATITGKYSGITFKTTIKVTAKLGKNEIYNSNGIKISYAGTTSYYEKNFVRLKIKSSTGKELSFILKYLLLDKKYVDGGVATFKAPSNFTSEKETKENIERKVYAVMLRMGFKDSHMGSTIMWELTCELLQVETTERQYRAALVSYAKSHGYEVKTMERNMSRAFEYAMTYGDYDYISSVLGDAGDSGRTQGAKELVIRLACGKRLGRKYDAERPLDSPAMNAVRVLMNYISVRMDVVI